MTSQTTSQRNSPQASRGERLLVLWLTVTFLLCVFSATPNELTASHGPFRRAARSYLRTLGLDQYWKMFVGNDWDMPQLRVIATTASGASSPVTQDVTHDVTQLFMRQGILYRRLLDDHVAVAHLVLARGEMPQVLASYARALRARLGPDAREIRFEQIFRTARLRRGSREPTTVVPLAVYAGD